MAHPYDSDLAGTGHNSDAFSATGDEIRQFIERWEQLETEKQDISEQQKEVMAEAKGRGFDTKIFRIIIKMRKKSDDERAEEDAVLQLYLSALGMV